MTDESLPYEVTTRVAKDQIRALTDRAERGECTTIRSRNVPIGVIEPVDALGPDRSKAQRISTTLIKTGKRSITGIVARSLSDGKPVILTVRGHQKASLRPVDKTRERSIQQDLREFVELLRTTQILQRANEDLAAKSRSVRELALGLLDHADQIKERLPNDFELARKLDDLRSALSVVDPASASEGKGR